MHRSARRLASLLEACSTSYASSSAAAGPAATAAATAAARAAATAIGRSAATPIVAAAQRSSLHTSTAPRDLREFLDDGPPNNNNNDAPTYGRAWKAAELRLKSWDDLHGLWYACLKERNLLETRMLWLASQGAREDGAKMAERDEYARRRKQVKLTMNRVKQVLSERACQELHPRRAAEMRRVIHLM